MSSGIQRIGVVGGGIMGAGIAEVCARAGSDVLLAEIDEERADVARERIQGSLERAWDRGKIGRGDALESIQGRISVCADLSAMADRELVLEAAVEDEPTKIAIFEALDDIVEDEEAVLASNTSSIPIMNLAMATRRRNHVLGLHFFNPVPVRPLVEIVPSLVTGTETLERMQGFIGDYLGKKPVLSKDRAGFIVNALLVPYLLNAIRMFESGFATAEDIDVGMVEGCSHPMGPLALTDLVGLDTTKAVAESLYEEFKEPLYAPPPLLSRMVGAGLLGRKSGRGFYVYMDQ